MRPTIEDAARSFTYDTLYRLIEATGREHSAFADMFDETDEAAKDIRPSDPLGLRAYSRTYAYHFNGNTTTMDHNRHGRDIVGARTAPTASVAPATRTAARSRGAPTTHDIHGNITEMPHLELLQWHFADGLQHVDKGSGTNQHTYFVYDASGQSVRKVWDHGQYRDERIYLGGYEIFRRYEDNAGTWELKEERETIRVSDDVRRVCMVETKTVADKSPVGTPVSLFRYQLDDHLGSACVEVDENGALITFEEYFPYGTSSFRSADSSSGVSAKRYRYTGKERDDETGLYYHGARYYAPWLGRWTAADPLAFADGVGSYTYVRGSPVNLSDPSRRTGRSASRA